MIAQRKYTQFLKQKAKIKWLQEEDDNTKAFYQSIKLRRLHNRTNTIQKGDGTWANDSSEVVDDFVDFYHKLLGTSGPIKKVDPSIIAKGKVLCQSHQQALNLRFTEDDIKVVVFSIPDDKAPGMDGFSSCFFKKSWNTVGKDVVDVVPDFFRHGKILKEINITTITLIPKITSAAAVGDFRPIACYTVIYKVITKLICTQLGKILPDIISRIQGAFINGRRIMSNILLCQDLVKRFGNKRSR